MSALIARVRNGRLVMDVPTSLPEGMELDLAPSEEDDGSRPDLGELLGALALSTEQHSAGQGVPADEALARIFARER